MNRARNLDVPPTLPDLLVPGLDLVFVGINPGETSARLGHYYANRGNAFWSLLAGSPLVSRGVGPEDDAALARATPLRIGFTDVVKRVETDSSKVETAEIREAAPAFRARLAHATPRAVCFTGARQFDVLFPGERGAWGHQEVDLVGAQIWVIPSTSGRAVAYRGEIAPILEDLAAALGVQRTGMAR
ncbi:MAG: mismatch-specific DNA-glycosylase [Chloroflexi bacterium]|nr:MAG: mismatch-specific DNA-glycosylase [Chloroflexota bacterium]